MEVCRREARKVYLEYFGWMWPDGIPKGWHIHHCTPISEGGDNHPSNLVCVSPEHHRQLHLERGDTWNHIIGWANLAGKIGGSRPKTMTEESIASRRASQVLATEAARVLPRSEKQLEHSRNQGKNIGRTLQENPEEASRRASIGNAKRVAAGTHNF